MIIGRCVVQNITNTRAANFDPKINYSSYRILTSADRYLESDNSRYEIIFNKNSTYYC
jgi:hypothetical protein